MSSTKAYVLLQILLLCAPFFIRKKQFAPETHPAAIYDDIAHPSSVVVFAVMCLFSAGACVWILLKYNSVNVFNRQIRTPNISNSWWIAFYAFVAFRYVFLVFSLYCNGNALLNTFNSVGSSATQCAYLTMSAKKDIEEDTIINFISLILHGNSIIVL